MNPEIIKKLEEAATSTVTIYACDEGGKSQALAIVEKVKTADPCLIKTIHVLCLGLQSTCNTIQSDAHPALATEQAATVKKISDFLEYLFLDSNFKK